MGRLSQPFPLRVPHKHNWYFACAQANRNKNKVRRFEEWLVKQVAADPALEALKNDTGN
jgi:LysR family transcriptional regulator, glycine cleavage system transcriptional activator